MLSDVVWYIIGKPLYYLYIEGPTWIGGWQSKKAPDICSAITGVDANFWEQHPHECQDTIDRQFNSLYALVRVATYVFLLYKASSVLLYHYTVIRPIHKILDKVTTVYSLTAESNYDHIYDTLQKQTFPRPQNEPAEPPRLRRSSRISHSG